MSFSPAWVGLTVLGIGLTVWMTALQWHTRRGHKGDLWAIAIITIPATVIGGRISHLITSPEPYFGPDGTPLAALAIWDGGFGFWGGFVIGFLAAWAITRFQGIRFLPFLDSVAPGLLLGRVAGAWADFAEARLSLATVVVESVWNLIGCVLAIVLARRLRLGHGQVFALYLCLFGLGRVWLHLLRLGSPAAESAHLIAGVPVNVWTAALTLIGGLVWFTASRIRHREPETVLYVRQSRAIHRRRGRGKHIYAALDPDPADSHRIQTSPGSATQASADGSAGVRGPGDQGIGELDEDGRHSFGFFGAVTSAISIVPDVRGRTESGQHPDSPGNTRSSGSGGSVH